MSWCDELSASNALEDHKYDWHAAAADDDDDGDGDYVWQLQREAQLEHQPHLQGARISGSKLPIYMIFVTICGPLFWSSSISISFDWKYFMA